METSELLKKVRKIEIKTRGLSKQVFSGEYHSAFKGRGMAFSEVRNYMPGDEIRTIDWNVTARFNDPYVKVFEEERELTVMLMVDISASEMFGTGEVSKREFIAEVGAVLAFSATQNNDKIGAILFSDKIELFIPPKKGRKHILRIIRELIEFKPNSNHTNIGEVLQNFNNLIKKRSIAFLISDFLNKDFEDALKITSKKHDLIALRVLDNREKLMRLEEISLNQRLLDNQEKSFLEADLKVYAASLESQKLSKSANKMVWLREFVEGYNNWSGRTFRHNRYPLQSYFVIDGLRKS